MKLGLIPDPEGAVNDESLDPYRSCLKWVLWAHYAAEMALQWPVDELAMEVAGCPDYAKKIVNIYKMLVVERSSADFRETVAVQMLDHVRGALLRGGVDLSDAIETDIDRAIVPQFPGLYPWEVNCLVVGLKPNVETMEA